MFVLFKPFLNQLGNKLDLKYYNLVQMFNVEIVERCLWLSENLVFLIKLAFL